jgi:RNA polymerase sigma factor (sigma-70 family)
MLIQENDILTQIRKEENTAFELLYKFYFPSVLYYVQQNSGNKEDAEDVFQEAIIVLLQKSKEPHFTLTSSIKTYLYAISKNLWLKRLRHYNLSFYANIEVFDECALEELEEIEEGVSLRDKLTEMIFRLSAGCQRILNLSFWFGDSIETIMKKVGYKNKHTVSSQKNKCLEKMRELSEKIR